MLKKVYFSGINGIGMSGIAKILKQKGYEVEGSDLEYKDATKNLEDLGIKLSSSKIRKILITGGCWSTERSREIKVLFDHYILPKSNGGLGLKRDAAVANIASDLDISVVTVSVNLPYESVVYKLEQKSSNAKRCKKYREGKIDGLYN